MAKVAGPLVKYIIIKLVKTPYILYGTYRGMKSKNLQTATFVSVDFSICMASGTKGPCHIHAHVGTTCTSIVLAS